MKPERGPVYRRTNPNPQEDKKNWTTRRGLSPPKASFRGKQGLNRLTRMKKPEIVTNKNQQKANC
ncbi:hypothetical protein C922_05472 [Plasmodium inui San Antonio 1]|uniref:Uncharacterized protein n=1 Tax=Plasmodium inui San Antonio 1 TaxID=1237626 RepID=W6ZT94_9APIC|nr:hypothetical protein C922_05472 [Plasmodium inui San Antonio 1]EUD64142.1 hypothetical protein C922_05472 [Plasmodium inui San Antonio 1]